MKITPPNGCIAAVYHESAILFCIGENWDAKEKFEQALADCLQHEYVNVQEGYEFDQNSSHTTVLFTATNEDGDEVEGFVELEWITLY